MISWQTHKLFYLPKLALGGLSISPAQFCAWQEGRTCRESALPPGWLTQSGSQIYHVMAIYHIIVICHIIVIYHIVLQPSVFLAQLPGIH